MSTNLAERLLEGNQRCPRMVNEEILGGLKSAIERGESLKRAMMTFFNSGYKKEEIEEAARALSESKPVETKPQVPVMPEKKQVPQEKTSKEMNPIKKISQKISDYGQQATVPNQPPKPAQKVSTYSSKQQDTKGKKTIIILFSLLAFLVILLILIFLFKQQLIDFFSRFFT